MIHPRCVTTIRTVPAYQPAYAPAYGDTVIIVPGAASCVSDVQVDR